MPDGRTPLQFLVRPWGLLMQGLGCWPSRALQQTDAHLKASSAAVLAACRLCQAARARRQLSLAANTALCVGLRCLAVQYTCIYFCTSIVSCRVDRRTAFFPGALKRHRL